MEFLTATSGMRITQAADVDDTQRGFWTVVALATNDSADNYTEWTEEAAADFIAALEEQQTEGSDDVG